MNGLFEAAVEVQEFLQDRGWRFAIIGGLAAIRWGEPQATQDVDLALFTGFGTEASYVEQVLGRFRGRIADAAEFALDNRVLLVSASNGIPVDISLAGIPYEEELIGRASPFCFAPGVSLVTCSAEDLVILKVFAGRPKDWAAIEGILIRQGAGMDWGYIGERLPPLCALRGEPELPARLAELHRQVRQGG